MQLAQDERPAQFDRQEHAPLSKLMSGAINLLAGNLDMNCTVTMKLYGEPGQMPTDEKFQFGISNLLISIIECHSVVVYE
jgi:hypothetical protein